MQLILNFCYNILSFICSTCFAGFVLPTGLTGVVGSFLHYCLLVNLYFPLPTFFLLAATSIAFKYSLIALGAALKLF